HLVLEAARASAPLETPGSGEGGAARLLTIRLPPIDDQLDAIGPLSLEHHGKVPVEHRVIARDDTEVWHQVPVRREKAMCHPPAPRRDPRAEAGGISARIRPRPRRPAGRPPCNSFRLPGRFFTVSPGRGKAGSALLANGHHALAHV